MGIFTNGYLFQEKEKISSNSILLIVGVILCLPLYNVYVRVIKSKNKVKEAISSVNAQLKKRYDLIPNIFEIAKKFLEHEKGLIEEIVKLRNQALKTASNFQNINDKIKLDEILNNKMSQLMVSVENYPELKSNEAMVTAMTIYNEVEEHIAAARRFYNSAVLELNNCVEIFPSSLIANMLGITKKISLQSEKAKENQLK